MRTTLIFTPLLIVASFVATKPLSLRPTTEIKHGVEVRRNFHPREARISHGNGFWFEQHGVAGACGKVHRDTDLVVALQTSMYAKGHYCGRNVEIIDTASNKKVVATVADMCPSCPQTEDLDMSVGLFTRFAQQDVGKLNVRWRFLN